MATTCASKPAGVALLNDPHVFIGSIVAVAILTMAVAALYSGVDQTSSNFRVSVALSSGSH